MDDERPVEVNMAIISKSFPIMKFNYARNICPYIYLIGREALKGAIVCS